MIKVSINSFKPKLNESYGKRAILAPAVLKSYAINKEGQDKSNIILNEYNESEECENIADLIIGQNTQIAFFSSYVWCIQKIRTVASLIKKKSNMLLVVGGCEITNTAEKVMSNDNNIDVIILGEGEEAFYELINKYKGNKDIFSDIPNIMFRVKNEIIKSEQKPFEDVSTHFYPLLIDEWGDCDRVCYETSRGCLMKCKFCLWHKGDNKLKFYPISKVKDDLARLFLLPKLKFLEIVDADICMNKSRAMEILKYIRHLNDIREKKKLRRIFIQLETNPLMLDDKLIDELAKHDRIVDFGLQTINEELNEDMKRIYSTNLYFKNLNKIVTVPGKYFGEYMIEIIYGLPDDTLNGFINTIEYVLGLPYDIDFWSFRFLVFPGTEYHDNAEKYGIIYNDNPPYQVQSTNSWTNLDLERAREISFYFCFLQYCLPNVYAHVKENIRHNKFDVYSNLIDLYKTKYIEIEKIKCNIGEETYQFQICKMFSEKSENLLLIKKIEKESFDLIEKSKISGNIVS